MSIHTSMPSQIGLIGLGTMGSALARNLVSRGFRVSVWNRTHEKVETFLKQYGQDSFYGSEHFEDFLESLEKPRRIMVMLPAGTATEEIIGQLENTLLLDDAVMDGGNSFFKDSEKMEKKLLEHGIHFLGTGISGGEEGALRGPSLMPGGSRDAWDLFEPYLVAIAAEDFRGKACVAYMGRGGAGHFVKMVHNGIEYAEMQALAEIYDMLRKIYRLRSDEIGAIFRDWNKGALNGFLLDTTLEILEKEEEGKPLLDLILDKAAQKGTGQWASEQALSLGVPTPSFTNAVFARGISIHKEERKDLSALYPSQGHAPRHLLSEFVMDAEQALILSRLANFEQGRALLKAGEDVHQFGFKFPEIIRVWQGGCIIRNKMLLPMEEALKESARSLYFAPFAQEFLNRGLDSWKRVVGLALEHSIPLFSISGGLSHFEAYRSEQLPANFIQGMRDRFGAHHYERVDKKGSFHTQWP